MARQLKSDLFRLQEVFTKNHDQFRVLNASVDELVCRFILKNKTFFDIQANIPDSYPSKPALWIVISEDATIIDLLEKPLETFNDSEERCNKIINQVVMIVQLMCGIHEEPLPSELDLLSNSNSIVDNDTDTGNESDDVSEDNADEDEEYESQDECEDDDDDEMFKIEASVSISATPTESAEIDAENAEILKKQQNLQFEKQSVGNSSWNKVLLKELDTIYRSEMYKNKTYSVELIDDKLNVWNVNLMSVCPDSMLQSELNRLKVQGLSGSIVMRITFEETYPFAPPFIQVTYPAIKGGHVLDQGALCMELLTTHGWSSAYTMENVLMQVSSTLTTGHARVDFDRTKMLLRQPYNQAQARKMFEIHANLHKKHGWELPAPRNS